MSELPLRAEAWQASEDWGKTYYDPIDVFRMGLALITARANGILQTKAEWRASEKVDDDS